jgi:hypothetical protein
MDYPGAQACFATLGGTGRVNGRGYKVSSILLPKMDNLKVDKLERMKGRSFEDFFIV